MPALPNSFFLKNRRLILYGSVAAILIFLLKWLQWRFLIIENSLDLYIGMIAVFFTILGVWMATKWVKPRVEKVVEEKEVYIPRPEEHAVNEAQLKKFDLSDREYEVLQLMAKGYSNADIGEKLFLSVSTIKTHASNLFVKMDVESRTQAIAKANRLEII